MRTNVEFFKLIDPVGQSLLFILFGYSLDSGISYNMVLLMLAAWQFASWGIHFFLKSVKLLKNERLMWLVTAIIFLPVYFYISRHVAEKYVEVRDAQTLAPVDRLSGSPVRVLAAAKLGGARLIDNINVTDEA